MRNFWWLLGVGALVWVGAHARAAVVSPLMSAFQATGARPAGYSLNDWVQVSGSSASMASLLTETGRAIHINGRPTAQQGVGYQKLSETAQVAGIHTELIVERLVNGSTYVVLDRTAPHGFRGLREAETLFAHVLGADGAVHSDVNLEGTIPHHLSMAQQRRLVQQALGAVGASSLNGVTTSGYVSEAGRSPFIAQSDQLQGQAVNIQVAASYNSYSHQTQVYVGTPLITVTY